MMPMQPQPMPTTAPTAVNNRPPTGPHPPAPLGGMQTLPMGPPTGGLQGGMQQLPAQPPQQGRFGQMPQQAQGRPSWTGGVMNNPQGRPSFTGGRMNQRGMGGQQQGRWGQMPPQAQGQPWSSIGQGRPGGNSMPAPAPTPHLSPAPGYDRGGMSYIGGSQNFDESTGLRFDDPRHPNNGGGNLMPAPAPTPTYHQNPLGPTGGVMPSPGGQRPMPQPQGFQQQPIMQPTPPIVPQQMSSDAMSAALRRRY